jgi:hypothetical protein
MILANLIHQFILVQGFFVLIDVKAFPFKRVDRFLADVFENKDSDSIRLYWVEYFGAAFVDGRTSGVKVARRNGKFTERWRGSD